MLKKMLLTAFFAVSFGITQAQSTGHFAAIAVNSRPDDSSLETPSVSQKSSAFYDHIPGISNLIGFAQKHLAIRYRSGGTTPGGFDCSGFTRFCYSKFGIALPHSSSAQGNVGVKVDKGSAMPGDLIFFKGHSVSGSGIGHVGMITEVVGKQIKFIHSAWGGGIRLDYLHADYYQNRFMGIRRVGKMLTAK